MNLSNYSDEFIISQYKYYSSLCPCPTFIREAGTINQLATDYEHEMRKREIKDKL